MDRALYVGMTGANEVMRQQTINSNNLANVSTVGFRAQLIASQAVGISGTTEQSRINTQLQDSTWDSTPGTIMQTGRDLDVAMQQGKWLTVQAADGTEAYTRAGNLQITSSGQLLTSSGQQVLSDNGPVTVPKYSSLSIGADGTLSIVPAGQSASVTTAVGRLKIVQADPSQLVRGDDGLMRATPGTTLDPASGTPVIPGALESSNVNLADTMVNMIQLARQFELNSKLMKATEDNDSASSSIVRMSG